MKEDNASIELKAGTASFTASAAMGVTFAEKLTVVGGLNTTVTAGAFDVSVALGLSINVNCSFGLMHEMERVHCAFLGMSKVDMSNSIGVKTREAHAAISSARSSNKAINNIKSKQSTWVKTTELTDMQNKITTQYNNTATQVQSTLTDSTVTIASSVTDIKAMSTTCGTLKVTAATNTKNITTYKQQATTLSKNIATLNSSAEAKVMTAGMLLLG